MGRAILKAESLRKSFGDLTAVDNLEFSINRGESFGFLGPNGAGKTTTISMLVGLLIPDEGQVFIDAGDRSGTPTTPEIRKLIGVAPQALSLYEELTAKENLEFFAQLYGLSGGKLRDRVTWALEFAQLVDRKSGRVSTFSGGMKRRLNIAVALIHDPEILLLDEPTVGVDPQSRNHIFESIQTLKKEGKTILYTTHYMEEAQRLCDRVAIIDKGKLLAEDTVSGLLNQFGGRSVVTAELLQVPSSIQLPGSLDGLDLRFESEQPVEDLAKLTGDGVKFQSLNINQPDLESVFLSLTGRSLRD